MTVPEKFWPVQLAADLLIQPAFAFRNMKSGIHVQVCIGGYPTVLLVGSLALGIFWIYFEVAEDLLALIGMRCALGIRRGLGFMQRRTGQLALMHTGHLLCAQQYWPTLLCVHQHRSPLMCTPMLVNSLMCTPILVTYYMYTNTHSYEQCSLLLCAH